MTAATPTRGPERPVAPSARGEPSAPYVGLRPYEERERALFFGRQRDARLLQNKILAGALTVLVAPSGVGKTSVLRALVIPKLRELDMHVVYFDDWTASPVASLRRSVAASASTEVEGDGAASLLELVKRVNRELDKSFVLVLDQFEQFFIRHARGLGAARGSSAQSPQALTEGLGAARGSSAQSPQALTEGLGAARGSSAQSPQALTEGLGAARGSSAQDSDTSMAVDALGQELGAVVRANVDAHIVLAMREEYLACLDDFRGHLLTAVQATHRLGPLSGEQARDAIRAPLTTPPFQGSIEDALVDVLLTDLRGQGEVAGLAEGPAGPAGISLPFLQIVCKHLWEASAGPGGHRIGVALYEKLGRRDGIVAAYVREATAHLSRAQRLDTARVLNLLAPRAGVKMAYPVEVLSAQLGLEKARLAAALENLDAKRIVRGRDSGGTQVVELYHDAFTRVLRPWIDDEIRASLAAAERLRAVERRNRRLRLGLAAIALLLLGVLTNWGVREWQEDQKLLAQLRSKECAEVTAATRDLWEQVHRPGSFARVRGRSGGEILSDLVAGLSANAEVAAACHGPSWGAAGRGGSSLKSPLLLRYHAKAKLQEEAIREAWRRLSALLWKEERIPLPSAIDVSEDRELPADSVALELDGRRVLRWDIPPSSREITILAADPPAQLETVARELEWPLSLKPGAPQRIDAQLLFFELAPAWSAPLWHVLGERFKLTLLPGPEAIIAREAFERMAAKPELYLTPSLVRTLLRNEQAESPCLVHEAVARFQDCASDACRDLALDHLTARVRDALIEAANAGRSIDVLGRILDRIADEPAAGPEAIVAWVVSDNGRGVPPPPIRLAARAWDGWTCPGPTFEVSQAYEAIVGAMDPAVAVRVRVGAPLSEQVGPDERPSPELAEEMYGVQRELNRRYGIWPPPIELQGEVWTKPRYRIEVLGAASTIDQEARDWKDMGAALKRVFEQTRAASITADRLPFDPEALAPRQTKWLRERFSRNDLKLLLRAVISSDPGGDPKAAEERSVHPLPWLLGSLPFWTLACGQEKRERSREEQGDCLVAHLRETQRARLHPKESGGAAPASIPKGLDAIERDDIDQAVRSFDAALTADAASATEAFLSAYGKMATPLLIRQVKARCEVPTPGSREGWARSDPMLRAAVEEVLDLVAPSDPSRRELELCGLMTRLGSPASGVSLGALRGKAARLPQASDDARLLRDLAHKNAPEWKGYSPEEVYWIGYHLLDAGARGGSPRLANRRVARDLLLTAFGAWKAAKGSVQPSDAAFQGLIALCQAAKSSPCFWDLASIADEAALGVTSILDLAHELMALKTNGSEQRLTRVRSLIERARDEGGSLGPLWSLRIDLVSATIALNLASYGKGDAAALIQALRATREQIAAKPGNDDLERWATVLIADASVNLGRYDEAAQEVEQGIARFHDDMDMLSLKILLTLEKGRADEAAAMADVLLRERLGTDPSALFLSALTQLLHDREDFARSAERLLFWVDHDYDDYARLLLSWRLMQRGRAAEARAILRDRMLRASASEAWREHLEDGDLAPWRERLVAYYLGERPREDVIGLVEDEAAFRKSPLSSAGQSFLTFRCEAFFYDALLQSVTGDEGTRQERYRKQLERVAAEKCFGAYEHIMARYLLKQADTK